MKMRSVPINLKVLKADSLQRRARADVGLTNSPQLQAQLQAVAVLPVVDTERVAALRKAIAEGSYRLDPQRIACSLLAQEKATL